MIFVDQSPHRNMGIGGGIFDGAEGLVAEKAGSLMKGKTSGNKQSGQVISGNMLCGQERVTPNPTPSKLTWKKRAHRESSLILQKICITCLAWVHVKGKYLLSMG
jgi:hypothetical protein